MCKVEQKRLDFKSLKLTAGVVGSYVGDLDDVGSIVGDGVGLIGTGSVGFAVTGAAVVGVNVGRSVTGDLVGAGSVGLWRWEGGKLEGSVMI